MGIVGYVEFIDDINLEVDDVILNIEVLKMVMVILFFFIGKVVKVNIVVS